MGIRVRVIGHVNRLRERGNLIISRHVSYVDGLILGGLLPAIFVSKREIKTWPLIGQVIAISGTIFVDRIRKGKTADYVESISRLMANKINIFLFPEGTSTNGKKIMPFQTAFFRAPIAAKAPIIPVNISYESINGRPVDDKNKDQLYWYGDMDFFSHFWNLLGFKRIDIKLTVHDKIDSFYFHNDSVGRKQLSRRCYRVICDAAGIHSEQGQHLRNKDSILDIFDTP